MELLSSFLTVLASMQAQVANQASGTPWLVTILVFIGMLVVLVFVHELGHFVTALWMGIRVEEFGIGFPPRALTLFERKGVSYTLNWVPLGGFVRFGGEDNSLYGTGSLAEASPWRKIPVMFAGPLANLITAVVIFAVLFAIVGQPEPTGRGQLVDRVFAGSPAAAAGLQGGDIITSMAGQPVAEDTDIVKDVASANLGQSISIVVLRDGTEQPLTLTPGEWTHPETSTTHMGLGISYGPDIERVSLNPFLAIFASLEHTWNILVRIVIGLGQMLGGLFGLNEAPPGGLAGPVGIARATGEVIDAGGFTGFWNWMALISLNLAVLNLLPIPALDGSHIVFSLIEWVRGGKKVPPDKEAMVHFIGFVTLIGLIVIVSVSDVWNAIQGVPVIGQ